MRCPGFGRPDRNGACSPGPTGATRISKPYGSGGVIPTRGRTVGGGSGGAAVVRPCRGTREGEREREEFILWHDTFLKFMTLSHCARPPVSINVSALPGLYAPPDPELPKILSAPPSPVPRPTGRTIRKYAAEGQK